MPKPITNYLLAGCLILMFLLAGLAHGPVHRLDLAIMRQMTEARAGAPTSVQAAEILTTLGSAAFTLPVAAVAAILLLRRRQSIRALALVVTVLGERALVHGLKDWIGRPRPADGVYSIDSMAFPSGHAANSMTVYLAIAILVAPPAYRRQLVAAAVMLSCAIGLTRIFLGVHWPSDVIGGWALGLATVLVAVAATRRSGALTVEAKHEIVGRHGNTTREDEAS